MPVPGVAKRKQISRFLWFFLLIGLGFAIYGLVEYMNNNDIQFGSGLRGTRLVTLAELARHNFTEDCYVAYHGEVYDMTFYATKHPGGEAMVTNLCGTDGTEQYDLFHPVSLLETVSKYVVGPLSEIDENAESSPPTLSPSTGPTVSPSENPTRMPVVGTYPPTVSFAPTRSPTPKPTPKPTPSPTQDGLVPLAELQKHSTENDCWVVYYGIVYDQTVYANKHPGGRKEIIQVCGTDGTAAFSKVKKHDQKLLLTLNQNDIIGPFQAS